MNKIYLFALLIGLGTGLWGQSVPTPAPPAEGALLLNNAVVHIGNGTVVENGGVLIRDGKIEQAGVIRGRVSGIKTVDLAGKHIYPGLIAPMTQLGIDEIGAVRATDDRDEAGSVNPNARAIVGYNTDSRVIPTVRSNGILMAQIVPQGGLFPGTSSIVQLDAWNWEDAAYVIDDAVHLNWPRMTVWEAWWAPPVEKQKKSIKENMEKLNQFMEEAKAYQILKASGRTYKSDIKLEAIVPVLSGEKPLFISANSEQQIRAAVAFMLLHEVRMVLVGGADAWRVKAELKKYEIPVVLAPTQSLPRHSESDIDQPFKTPQMLKEAGIPFCLSGGGFWQQRNLPFQAGQAVAFGLAPEAAIQAMTLDAAKILGIADSSGSLEVGKDATLIVSEGDVMDYRTSQIVHAFIQGREIDLGNKQKALYTKFKQKYDGQ